MIFDARASMSQWLGSALHAYCACVCACGSALASSLASGSVTLWVQSCWSGQVMSRVNRCRRLEFEHSTSACATQGRAVCVFPELTELSWHGVAIEYVPGYATEFAYFCTSSSISTGTTRSCGSLPLARGHRYRLN